MPVVLPINVHPATGKANWIAQDATVEFSVNPATALAQWLAFSPSVQGPPIVVTPTTGVAQWKAFNAIPPINVFPETAIAKWVGGKAVVVLTPGPPPISPGIIWEFLETEDRTKQVSSDPTRENGPRVIYDFTKPEEIVNLQATGMTLSDYSLEEGKLAVPDTAYTYQTPVEAVTGIPLSIHSQRIKGTAFFVVTIRVRRSIA